MRKQNAYDMSIDSSMASAKSSLLFMILEKLQVAPGFTSPESATEFSLPLTFFDTYWFKFPPVERVFFYELAKPPAYFNSVVLPKLKESLARTLVHFLPLAGSLVWSPESEPVILYSPNDGSVSLTVAESNIEDYDRLCGKEIQEASDSRPFLPELPMSETRASVIALQITLFPNKGFSIGIISHHAVLDGKSAIMFFKAWAYLCNDLLAKDQPQDQLPDELVPCFDRDGIHDATGLKSELLNQWSYLISKSDSSYNPRSLKLRSHTPAGAPQTVRATFELTRQDIGKLRKWVSSQLNIDFPNEEAKPVSYLSTFVLVCAYISVCLVKARQGDGDRDVLFVYSADARRRIDPPLPQNYFGNAISAKYFIMKARELMDENGFAMVAKRIGGSINDLEKGLLEGVEEHLPRLFSLHPETQCISVAGSNRFGVYGSDFGWGRPKKVEITSIDGTGAMSLAESRDGNGVEIGLALNRHEMEAFVPLFVNGLKELRG